jgi:hypothetical protein
MEKTKNKSKNPHYVCTGGCGLVSEIPGKCTTRGCLRHRNPLTICHCRNGKHGKLSTLNVPRD